MVLVFGEDRQAAARVEGGGRLECEGALGADAEFAEGDGDDGEADEWGVFAGVAIDAEDHGEVGVFLDIDDIAGGEPG